MGLLDAFAKRVCTGKLVSRRSYTFFVGPVWILLGLSFFLGIYGFGTWVVPLAEQEFCEGYQNEARCGVMYPFASIFLVMSVSTATAPNYVPKTGVRNAYAAMLLLFVGGLVVCGVAVASSQVGLLWLGFTVMVGFAAGPMFIVVLKVTYAWYAPAGRAGLGAGLMGLFSGLWPALNSLVSNPIANAIGGYANFFYLLAGLVFATGLPAAFLFTYHDAGRVGAGAGRF